MQGGYWKRVIKAAVGPNLLRLGQYAVQRLRVHKNRLARTCNPARRGQPFPDMTIRRYAHQGQQTFFGYFDKTPFSADNTRLLACSTPLKRVSPSASDPLAVGWFNLDAPDTFNPLGTTTTWCWQQSCMLQWHPQQPAQWVVYNRPAGGAPHGSVIQDVHTGEVISEFDRGVYTLSSTGDVAISLNFARLHRHRPGYGYAGASDPFANDPRPREDGVWRLDMRTGQSELLHSVHDLAEIQPQSGMEAANHYLNHAVFAPSGKRFVFFHIWDCQGRRSIRMFTCNEDGSNLYLLTNEKMVSHFDWKSDSELLAYAEHAEHGRHFYYYQDRTQERYVYRPDALKVDGHPSFSPDNRSLLCDTYPDPYGEQTLFLLTPHGNRVDLVRLPSPGFMDQEFRCDLHPRWDTGGRVACVDSAHSGQRSIYTIEVAESLISSSPA